MRPLAPTFSRWTAAGVIALTSTLGACDKHDIGQPCEALLQEQPSASEENRTETQEVVGQSTSFPCEELICIATDGKTGYCSKKCRNDSGCPGGFECRVIQTIGEFAGEQFCAWKPCAIRADCGTVEEFCCSTVEGVDPVNELKLCEFSSKKGKCE